MFYSIDIAFSLHANEEVDINLMYIEHIIIKIAIVIEITDLTYIAEIERHLVTRINLAIEILLDLIIKCSRDVVKLCIFCSRISCFCKEEVVDLVFRRCVVYVVDISCLRLISEKFLI